MEAFLKYIRGRFILPDLMHLADADNETLKLLLFQNGPSRNEFIKFFVCKLLLDVDPEIEDSQKHNLENIFVSFGLLNREDAQHFLEGNLPTKVHIATWTRIIEALIPTTTITPQQSTYDEMLNKIFEKNQYFQSVTKKNYLPPELIPKLKVQTVLNENNESIEKLYNEITEIIKKPIRPDGNNDDNSCHVKQSLICENSDCMDLISIKQEIDRYNQVSNENEIIQLQDVQSNAMASQNCFEINGLDAKVNNIHKLMKAENDLQILVNSLADQ